MMPVAKAVAFESFQLRAAFVNVYLSGTGYRIIWLMIPRLRLLLYVLISLNCG